MEFVSDLARKIAGFTPALRHGISKAGWLGVTSIRVLLRPGDMVAAIQSGVAYGLEFESNPVISLKDVYEFLGEDLRDDRSLLGKESSFPGFVLERKVWSKKKFGNVTRELEKLRQDLRHIKMDGGIVRPSSPRLHRRLLHVRRRVANARSQSVGVRRRAKAPREARWLFPERPYRQAKAQLGPIQSLLGNRGRGLDANRREIHGMPRALDDHGVERGDNLAACKMDNGLGVDHVIHSECQI
uniref:Uncharacterized protein n=1 Tax=Leersia perrieri TaxID=77586 RepID=A0A0D9WQK7_9ORYZ